MVDEQFRRPGSEAGAHSVPPRAPAAVWQPETPPVVETEVTESDLQPEGDEKPRGTQLRTGLILGAAGLLVGLAVGAVFIEAPPPAPLPITLDTFPTEVLGQERDDIEWRTANSTPVVQRLDEQFADQLAGYRFAYGGAGAEFSYGEIYTLTIVNGRLAPQVPISRDPNWSTPTVISLNSGVTSCVSQQESLMWEVTDEMRLPRGSVVIDTETGIQLDPETGIQAVWTECVLVDDERGISLRLTGRDDAEGMLEMASRFRDELVTIHAHLIN